MSILQLNTPPPLAAAAQRPDRDEAVEALVSRYNRSSLINWMAAGLHNYILCISNCLNNLNLLRDS